MPAMPPIHPIIVHAPIVLIIVSFLFELIGRAMDADWWRKAAFAMLILGALGAAAAVWTGNPTGEAAEHQGVAEHAVDEHEEAGRLTLWLALGAVVVRAAAGWTGAARPAFGALALLLHLGAAVAVGVAGYRGGMLVYEHGAGVKVHGQRVPSDGPPKSEEATEKD